MLAGCIADKVHYVNGPGEVLHFDAAGEELSVYACEEVRLMDLPRGNP